MRDFKFRAWDKVYKTMIYNIQRIYDGLSDEDSGIDQDKLYASNLSKSCFGYNLNDPDIEVMQFTGLKDKNGKEIYEGDTGKSWYDRSLIWEVYWNDDDARFWLRSGIREYGDMNCSDDLEAGVNWLEFEVIGNIYENPELLKS